jgi:aspartyl-tRNA(Asn)/glutamyl-tRNA(Gln) amidotransferase subunit C
MEKKDLLHLANLSRIRIEDQEIDSLKKDVESVIEYVSAVNSITADASLTKKIGAVYNVFREDAVSNASGSYTEAILKEAPKVKGRYQVKKIIQQD